MGRLAGYRVVGFELEGLGLRVVRFGVKSKEKGQFTPCFRRTDLSSNQATIRGQAFEPFLKGHYSDGNQVRIMITIATPNAEHRLSVNFTGCTQWHEGWGLDCE